MYKYRGDNMSRANLGAVRANFTEALNRVAYGGERIVVGRRGKDLAALVPLADLELLNELEDCMDLEAAREALKEPGTVAWADVRKKLGL